MISEYRKQLIELAKEFVLSAKEIKEFIQIHDDFDELLMYLIFDNAI